MYFATINQKLGKTSFFIKHQAAQMLILANSKNYEMGFANVLLENP
jgi:hypothetical protein